MKWEKGPREGPIFSDVAAVTKPAAPMAGVLPTTIPQQPMVVVEQGLAGCLTWQGVLFGFFLGCLVVLLANLIECDDVRRSYDRLQHEFNDIKAALSDAHASLAALGGVTDRQKGELDQLQKDKDLHVGLRRSHGLLETSLDAIRKLVASQATELDQLQLEKSGFERSRDLVQDTLRESQATSDAQSIELASLRKVAVAHSTLRQAHDGLQGRLNESEALCQSRDTTITELRQRISTKFIENLELANRAKSLEIRYGSDEAGRERVARNFQLWSQSSDEQREEASGQPRTIKSLEVALKDLEKKNEELAREKAKLEVERETAVLDAQEAAARHQDKNRTDGEVLRAAVSRADDLEATLEALQSRTERTKEALNDKTQQVVDGEAARHQEALRAAESRAQDLEARLEELEAGAKRRQETADRAAQKHLQDLESSRQSALKTREREIQAQDEVNILKDRLQATENELDVSNLAVRQSQSDHQTAVKGQREAQEESGGLKEQVQLLLDQLQASKREASNELENFKAAAERYCQDLTPRKEAHFLPSSSNQVPEASTNGASESWTETYPALEEQPEEEQMDWSVLQPEVQPDLPAQEAQSGPEPELEPESMVLTWDSPAREVQPSLPPAPEAQAAPMIITPSLPEPQPAQAAPVPAPAPEPESTTMAWEVPAPEVQPSLPPAPEAQAAPVIFTPSLPAPATPAPAPTPTPAPSPRPAPSPAYSPAPRPAPSSSSPSVAAPSPRPTSTSFTPGRPLPLAQLGLMTPMNPLLLGHRMPAVVPRLPPRVGPESSDESDLDLSDTHSEDNEDDAGNEHNADNAGNEVAVDDDEDENKEDEVDWETDSLFEDVPIPGLNSPAVPAAPKKEKEPAKEEVLEKDETYVVLTESTGKT